MGTGLPGARALAKAMKADAYKFATCSGIPAVVGQPCGTYDVEVEFIDTGRSNSFPVKFTFENGRVVQASGWTVWFTTGALTVPRD